METIKFVVYAVVIIVAFAYAVVLAARHHT